ncbi:permease [Pelagibacterium luteolum]|uniref:Predicted permease n=1 Tax=Pelagibacterium luteolum TaxID=440168 RepID=A0A1G7SXF2_9HYPH|nr:permease [Pelagibacterium luteolum]SDG27756.1 Predicted permease [Pelagibacterium luteolum]
MSSNKAKKAPVLDGALAFLLGLAVVTGALAVWLNGLEAIQIAIEIVLSDLILIVPMIALGVVVGTLFTVIVPRKIVSRYLGRQAGARGIWLATIIGTLMPAGPFASFPLVLALGRSGASIGPLIAFLTAWATVGLNRLIIWELPFMGAEFSLLRFLTSLPLPIIAGFVAERLSRNVSGLRTDWHGS